MIVVVVGSIVTSLEVHEVRGLLLLVFVLYGSVDPYVEIKVMDYMIRIKCTDRVIRKFNLNIRIT